MNYAPILFSALASMQRGRLRVVLPDGGERIFGGLGEEPRAEIRIKDEAFFRACVLGGPVGFGEAHMDGLWETDDLVGVIAWFIRNADESTVLEGSGKTDRRIGLMNFAHRVAHKLRPNSLRTSRRNIREHYDLSNEFFALWLDPTMTYSAAYWDRPDMTLEQAQVRKYDVLCRKLRLQLSDQVLEIGSGWGGFSMHAAKNFGCRVTTVTISQAQFDEASRRIAAAGLTDRIDLRVQDYRTLGGTFDKIASIEMLEAVGDKYLDGYFAQCHRLLARKGLLGLQYITCPDAQYEVLRRGTDFIQRHIFPGSLLNSIGRVNVALNRTGDLFLHDLDDMGPYYARTLHVWRDNFHRVLESVRAQGFDETFIRKWDYYLAYCEAAFATRHISVVQAIYTRADNETLDRPTGLNRGVLVMPEWGEFSRLMVFALAIPMVMMAGVWVMARVLNNAGIVDIFWSYGFIPVAVVCAALSSGEVTRNFVLVLMVTIWAARLGTYLLIRVAKHHPEEDGRYATLRTQFPNHTWAMFFGFFEAQGLLIALLSVPFVLVFINDAAGLGFFEYVGIALWLTGMIGESVADAQLNRFRANPANKGKTCRVGLWNFSRHPNYFCEWLVWVGYFVYALGSPGGWIAVYAPALMYFFLTRITGIKATEEHAVRSRGEDYRQYQRTTNAFFPWFPRRTS